MIKLIKSGRKLKHRNHNYLIKTNFICFSYKAFEVGINPVEGLFSIDVRCKLIIFTKNSII